MLPELHPFLEREYAFWWPYAYFFLLSLLITGVVWFACRLIRRYRGNGALRRAVRHVALSTREENDVAFLKSVALELFAVTCVSSGMAYPCEEWLKAISNRDTDFTVWPYRVLLDACLQSPESVPRLTIEERELIRKNIIHLMRERYV